MSYLQSEQEIITQVKYQNGPTKNNMESMEKILSKHDKELYGDGSNLGISQKVTVLWRLHTWLLCSLSALAGSGITIAVQRIMH